MALLLQKQSAFLLLAQEFVSPLLFLGSVVFQTFGCYLTPAFPCFGGKGRDFIALQTLQRSKRKLGSLELQTAYWSGTLPALVREACDTIQTSFTGSI